jgi:hypothetical protein
VFIEVNKAFSASSNNIHIFKIKRVIIKKMYNKIPRNNFCEGKIYTLLLQCSLYFVMKNSHIRKVVKIMFSKPNLKKNRTRFQPVKELSKAKHSNTFFHQSKHILTVAMQPARRRCRRACQLYTNHSARPVSRATKQQQLPRRRC